MLGLAEIAALASGAAYHDAPGTGSQASPPTTQSTTQTVQNTTQSTTQTSPSVSTVQTNTTHTGDVVSTETIVTNAAETNTFTESSEFNLSVNPTEGVSYSDENSFFTSNNDADIQIKEIARRNDVNEDPRVDCGNSTNNETDEIIVPNKPNDNADVTDVNDETTTLDRRRNEDTDLNTETTPLVTNAPICMEESTEKLAPRASPEADDLD